MAFYSGNTGAVTVAGGIVPATNITDWTLTQGHRVTDHVIMGNVGVDRVGHAVEGTGSFTAMPGAGELLLLVAGATALLTLSTSTTGNTMTLNAIFTEVSQSVSADGTVSTAVSYESDTLVTVSST